MNSKEAIERIKAVLGFSEYTFGTYAIKEGGEFKVDGELEAEKEIYIVTEEGELPSPDGDFQLEDGTTVIVKDGKIQEVKPLEEVLEEEVIGTEEEVMEKDEEEEVMESEESKMASVSLIDGTIVGNEEEELAVGQELFIITEEGKTAAPDGEHETEDGKIIVIAEGVITEIKDKEEEVIEESVTEEVALSEVIEQFTLALEALKNEITSIKTENTELKEKFSKFSNEPAGERVYTQKTLKDERFSYKTDRLTTLSQLRRK